mmetsp:Transcript_52093/g.95380  ORF Transcript_52093/g.95380 Transcript_52093/m.95380 type:complete len:489 (+) Transcript_52093:52-1518(+)
MENGSEDSHHKHTIDNGNDKKLIVVCEDPTEGSNMNKRILALEKALQELGCHFVKYQEDVAGILVEECSRLTQQMNEQKEKIQRRTHEQVQNALSRAREDMLIELNAELKRRLESSPLAITKCKENVSRQEMGSTAATEDLDMTAEQLRKSMNEMRKEISEVYAGSTAATGLVMTAELRKLMNEMRKEINEVHTVLSLRAGATDKRVEALETSAARKQVTDITDNTRVDVCLADKLNQRVRSGSGPNVASRSSSQSTRTSRAPSVSSVASHSVASHVGRQLNDLIRDHSPRPKLSQKMGEVNAVLESLVTAVSKALPAPETDDEQSCDSLSVASIDSGIKRLSEPRAGSCQLPVARLDSGPGPETPTKRSGSMHFAVRPSGAVAYGGPQRNGPQGTAPPNFIQSVPIQSAPTSPKIVAPSQNVTVTQWSTMKKQVTVTKSQPSASPLRSGSLSRAMSPHVVIRKSQSALSQPSDKSDPAFDGSLRCPI